MKTRIVLYGENNAPLSVLGDNPQKKIKKAWDAAVALLAATTDDILRVESVEVWDSDADTPQTESTGSPIGDYRDGVGAWSDCPRK